MQRIWHTSDQGRTYNDSNALGWKRHDDPFLMAKPGAWTVMYCGGIDAVEMLGIRPCFVAAVMDDFGNLVKVEA